MNNKYEDMLYSRCMEDVECAEEFINHIQKSHDDTVGESVRRITHALKFRKITVKRKVGKRTVRSQLIVRSTFKHGLEIEIDLKIHDLTGEDFKREMMCDWNKQ